MPSIRILFTVLFIAMGLCSLAMFSMTQKLAELREESRHYQEQLYSFYQLSQELKQSSDHLTKFARAYSVTGDEKWEALFNRVLQVRNGEAPIPEGNAYEYWDVVVNSDVDFESEGNQTTIPLLERIQASGIDAMEYLELKSALQLSNTLVQLERQAFLAIKGYQIDEYGHEVYVGKVDLEKAQALLYGTSYFSEKERIMSAIGTAHAAILDRIENKIEQVTTVEGRYETFNKLILVVLLSSITISFVLLWLLYISPLSRLLNTVVRQVKDQDYAFTITQKAYAELQKFIDSLNVVFHHISEQLNHNTLVKDFNIVLRTSQSTEVLCREVTQFLLRQFPLQMIALYIYQDDQLKRISGAGFSESTNDVIRDPSSTEMSVLLSGQPYNMNNLSGKYSLLINGASLELNEIYYFPLCVNGQPVALLELGTTECLSTQQYNWLTQMLDDLSVSIQLSQNVELQRKAEQKVLEQSLLNQEILNATPNPMYCLSRDGVYLTVNAKFCDMVGLSMNEIVGSTPSELFSRSTAQVFTTVHNELSKQQSNRDYELSLYDKSDQLREMLVYEASFNNVNGEVSGIVGILLDLTERKQMENELRDAKDTADAMSQAKGDFLANMSHEIRTPMNAILGMAHLALNTELDPTQQKYLSRINESAKNLLGIINDILDFSKIEAGKLSVEHIDFNLDEVFENMTNVVSFKANEKGVEFLLDIDPKVPIGLIGDPLRLGQILVNLCGNAVKFTEKGEIVVAVSVDELTEKSVVLRFAVRDTGKGIAPDKMQNLFSAFSQADNSITREFGGTGLGLSISKQLVELMDGGITVSSSEGIGSTFSFTIRCGLQEAKMRDIAESIPTLAGNTALVVDDNDSARSILVTLLTAMRFDAKAVSNAYEALDELSSQHFDMLFVDWTMPGMNGLELFQRAEKENLLQDSKKFLVTAYGRELSLIEESHKMLDGLIVKPVNPSNLLDAIMDAFGIEHLNRHQSSMITERPHFARQTVLLVEDNVVNQEVAQGILEGTNLNIIVANHGEEAISLLNTHSVDLVLMDMQMPVMDGITATKQIRKNPQWESLPIIAMTANAMQSDVEHCIASGMNGHIAKPINVSNFYQTLSAYLSSSEGKVAVSKQVSQHKNVHPSYPVLEGIDVEQAIFNTGGNAKSYFSIFERFLDSQLIDTQSMIDIADSKDWENLGRMAHTLKGASANLGVDSIARLARKIEELTADESDGVIAICNQVRQVVIQLKEQLSEWQRSHQREVKSTDHEMNELYGQLMEKVDNYDVTALDVIKQVKHSDLWDSEQTETLINLIENFEFEQAKELLTQLPKPE
ncbi:response regulator [Vibrio atypicus]|uniref:response regulator n=1 Tax=Vibrio atypicus TaxID=558271 RepID=UPI001359DBC5|nr:response regulator [Vibrio atypicus]